MGPVSYVPEQSRTASSLSRHLVAAMSEGGDDDRVEEIMLGLLAGGDVTEPVVDGTVAWTTTHGSDDVADILGAALEWPAGREALLEGRFNLLAVGPDVSLDGNRTTLLLGSWERFEGHSIQADSRNAFLSLENARKRLNKPLGIMPDIDERALQLAKEIDDGGSASSAADSLLQTAVDRYQHNMNGWALYPRTLEDIVWPEELLDAPQVYVSIAVAVERHPDAAWSRNLILIAAHFPEKGRVATVPVAVPQVAAK